MKGKIVERKHLIKMW